MKITKRQLRRIIKEEAADCAKDYRLGTLSREEYEDCLKRFEEPDDYGYSYRRYPPRKTSYVGADANQEKIAAVQAAMEAKPNNFLQSVLSQLQRGRGLSRKQNAIVKKILVKTDPEAAKLFERKNTNKMRITENKLRRIIREKLSKVILNEGMHPYDKGLMQAMDVGYYSDSDAVGEIEGDLMRVDTAGLSPAAMEELEELKYAIEGGYNDDAYDLLRSIPKEIKDRLPVQEFDDGMDDDW